MGKFTFLLKIIFLLCYAHSSFQRRTKSTKNKKLEVRMSNTPTPKKSSISKILLRTFFILLCCLVLFAAFIPTLISSSWGKEKLTAMLNQSIPGKVKIDHLSIGWFGPQSVQGVVLFDPQNNTVVSLESLNVGSSLFGLIIHPKSAGSLEFKNLNATIVGDSEGNTNLMRALDKRCCDNTEKGGTPVAITLKNTNGTFNLSKDGPVTLQLIGETLQNSLQGKFLVDAEMKGITLQEVMDSTSDLANLLNSKPNAELKIHTDIANFPVELIDQILSLRKPEFSGLLTEVLGGELSLKVDQKATTHGISLNIQANSPTLSTHTDLLIDKEITLAKPTQLSLQLSPALADLLFKQAKLKSSWRLASPTSASLTLTSLSIPLNALKSSLSEIDVDAIGLTGALDLGQATFTEKEKNARLLLKGMHVNIATEPNTPTVAIAVTSEAAHNDQPTKINFTLSLPKKTFLKEFSHLSLKDLVLNGDVNGAPLALLDGFIDSPVLPSMILGSHADLVFGLNSQENKPAATIQFKSEFLEIPRLAFFVNDKLTLQKPAQIILKLNQSLVNQVFKDVGPQMQGPATAQLLINSFSLPINNLPTTLRMVYKLDLDAQLKVTSMRLANVPTIGAVSLNDFSVHLTADPQSRPELTASFSLQPDGQSALANVLGKKTSFKTIASLGIGVNGRPTANVFNLQVVSDLARLELSGEMHEGNRVVLNAPTMLSYTFTAAGLQTMGIATDSYLFKHGAPLEMTIDASHIPLSFKDLTMLSLKGKLKINDFQLMPKGQKGGSLAVIDNLNADWKIDAATKLMAIDFTGVTRLGENQAAGKLNGSITVNNWIYGGAIDLSKAVVVVNANASKLPTELVSALSGQKDLVPILGNAIDLSIEANAAITSAEKGTIALDINSQNLSGGIALVLGDLIQLSNNRPAEFSLKLTPQSYAALRQRINQNYAGDFTLTEPTTATLKIRSLRFPRSQSFLQSGIEGDFSLGRLVGMDTETKNKISLNSIEGRLSSQNIADKVDFSMNAQGRNEQGNATAWNMLGSLTKGFNTDGSINKQDLSMTLDANIDSLPIPLLCQFACVDTKLKQQIEAVFGPNLDAKIQAKLHRMNGPVFVDVKGKNGRLTLDATLNEGIMTLNQDMTAQLTVTPELGEYVLKDLIPVISGMLSADHPIHLTISREGFAVPLRDPSILSVAIGKATLDLGKVRFSGQSQIAKVLSLLTPTSSDQLVWLTPAYFSLNGGFLKLERVDMLISDRYPIAAWGDVDIGRDRVNMIIGLSGSAIAKAFSVPGISNSYFLQLPLRGRLNNPSIDKTKAVARLSALVAQSQGGPQGLVLGTVLDIATGGLTDPAIPNPTTNPIPWSDMMKDSTASPSSADAKADPEGKAKVNPIEEIGKGASSLLKKIFK